jgi:hypothetical protein
MYGARSARSALLQGVGSSTALAAAEREGEDTNNTPKYEWRTS